MANARQSVHEPKDQAPVGRSLGTIAGQTDLMTKIQFEVLSDSMEVRKANTLISASRQFNSLVTTVMRAARAGIPEQVRKIASLPERTA